MTGDYRFLLNYPRNGKLLVETIALIYLSDVKKLGRNSNYLRSGVDAARLIG